MCLIYSSGTTSKPKAIPHSIKDLVNNALSFGTMMKITHRNRFCNFLSLMYLGGYYNLLILPYVLNSSVVLTNVFFTIYFSFSTPVFIQDAIKMMDVDYPNKHLCHYTKGSIFFCRAANGQKGITRDIKE